MTAYDRMLQNEAFDWNEGYDSECTDGEIIEDTLNEINSPKVSKLIDDLGLDVISIKKLGKFDKEEFEIYTSTGIF